MEEGDTLIQTWKLMSISVFVLNGKHVLSQKYQLIYI